MAHDRLLLLDAHSLYQISTYFAWELNWIFSWFWDGPSQLICPISTPEGEHFCSTFLKNLKKQAIKSQNEFKNRGEASEARREQPCCVHARYSQLEAQQLHFGPTGEKAGPNQIELAGSGCFKCFISESHRSRTVVSSPTLGKHSTSGSGVTHVPRLQSPTRGRSSISP